ncbi:TetR/AcrR family transcriptional regulator [Vibrio sinaloensis]|uniref:TetR/AcrR family transcriptional regulator n=1 Tax=Photobacterium sp. (strain ATCC 43367) TaxID=379097 RepID=UPI002058C608|nr:TetR/AcrR family transcriptional regulator [Vibrio sinaloensis]UPQ89730.1 TetR/AcrR family transcriptional regulator [Vibrio sinaloensis]
MNAKTQDTRQHILDVGYQLVVTKGFTAVGLSELLKTADVPKGSFYHYFKSKEQFGQALIEEYFKTYLARSHAVLHNGEGNGRQRVIDYFSRWLEIENGVCNANKCLVVKLSAEVSDLSEAMRVTLAQGADKIIEQLASSIESGVQDGSIATLDSAATARILYQQWLGASLLNKLNQDQVNLHQCFAATERMLNA